MEVITKYKAKDGSLWDKISDCIRREELVEQCELALEPLVVPVEFREALRANKGYYQHDPEAVIEAREKILVLARPSYAEQFPIFKNHGRDVPPLSAVGRILDGDDPQSKAWFRFGFIDERGREFQQCYYAYGNGRSEQTTNCLNS